jgi:hypothetical protein
MADEIIFYADQSGVRVTDKSVIIGNTTYSLADITSVSTAAVNPSRAGPMIVMVVGFAVLSDQIFHKAFGPALFGAIVLVCGYFWYRGAKPVWHLRIASVSGQTTPLHSLNQRWISDIAQAINEAIIHRA